jgi:hypothetical protein
MKDGEIYGVKYDEHGRIFCEDYPTEDNFIIIDPPKIKYVQRDDLSSEDFQELEVSMDSSGVGYYPVISTKRWSIDKIEDLIAILKDYQSRFTYKGHYENN